MKRGLPAYLLDGDELRHGICGDLAFSRADREENVRRVGELARLFADSGMIAIAAVALASGKFTILVPAVTGVALLPVLSVAMRKSPGVAWSRSPLVAS